jgi:hypothetical protein
LIYLLHTILFLEQFVKRAEYFAEVSYYPLCSRYYMAYYG